MKNYLLLLLFVAPLAGFAQKAYTLETVPNPKSSPSSHYVSNPDGIISPKSVARIDSMLQALEDSTTAQVAVVVLNSIGEAIPKDFATALFKKWGIGYAQKSNGLLILLVKDQRRMEFETGLGLEGILPDAICKRIQMEKMVPYAKIGNYDTCLINGVSAVVQTIMQPEAAKEAYDPSKYNPASPKSDNNPYMDSGSMGLWIIFYPFLLLAGFITKLFRNQGNKTKQLINSKTSVGYKAFRIIVLNILIPVAGFLYLGMGNVQLYPWQFFLLISTYGGLLFAERRWKSSQIFEKEFGESSEPNRYIRLRRLLNNSTLKAILFPIPMAWFWYDDRKRLDFLRNHPRGTDTCSPTGMRKLTDDEKATVLSDFQKIEEKLKSVEYDVWQCDTTGKREFIAYEDIDQAIYYTCGACHTKANSFDKREVLEEATFEAEGKAKNLFSCKACGSRTESIVVIPKRTLNTRTNFSSGSGSSWSSGSSSSSSSGSSWGGGRSGGGGSGSSW